MVNALRSTQPFILLRLVKRVRGTPGDWVVKQMSQHLLFLGEWKNFCSTTKIGLSSPVPLMVFSEKGEFVVFMQFLVIFPKTSPPPSLRVNTKWEILELELPLILWAHHSNIWRNKQWRISWNIRKYCYIVFIWK